jgi:ABC-type antimicrobial peptide transport system permease subunit
VCSSDLAISYSFRKRRFEFSILKVFGSTNFELMLNLLFEVLIIATTIMLLTTLVYFSVYWYMGLLIANGYLPDYNYLPISFTNIIVILSILMFVLTVGSLDSARSIFKINVSENLRHD